ncbi:MULTISPECIES: ROK family transcriptional regulator [unclassified Microbacterium]|uniref:ROK family transcriptional regulator n=1 Tax=unclassified Microbacterium TaxID=2609290 RepID=UPI001656A6EA|nr:MULTISPECIES: ROK family transcriptional regulator [unclassified Microbacterium]MDH5134889.1 ROK family transcriptional regulator [Microbacterium sp. RD10]MDH5137823.1 ROK family transcriptional regulator [Microbacterium sp. RD11]MDH5146765.1 ROK family transcriptional regulator [Microbacterium sp. RD12]MDH5155808.1 ROK family transcriptional regulator [Microbacterium sp. RD06]CAD5138397.1 Sugar kinase of the NBD/HSP70 family, may contain an N-terminal HTH domain [Microbacterium sp. Nx66]
MSVSDDQRPSATTDFVAANAHAFGPARHLRSRTKVLPEHARGHNRALVLQTLYHSGAMSRADLSRETGLTRVTISDLVAEFIADGIVVEIGVREAVGPGKPPILIDIDRVGHQIIGLDLSGPTAFEGAVLSLDGDVLERRQVPRPETPDGDAAYEALRGLAQTLVEIATQPVLGVGIGTPGVVRPDGLVLSSPNLGWTDFPLEAKLSADLDLPVLARNDANAAVLAEYTFGEAEADFMLIKIGRGVGAGLITGSQPLLGSRFAAGEIGHVVVGTDGGPRCACGKIGCLEAWLSVSRMQEALDADPAAREEILRDSGTRMAIAIAPIVAALDLSEVVLSGPAELLDGTLIDAAVETLHARTLEGVFEDVMVRLTRQDDIVLRGAAVMVLSGQLGVS